VAVDRYGNIFVTAHKANHGDVVSPDPRSPTGARSQSWVWFSSDGQRFSDLPGSTPLAEQNYEWGDEGDLAVDDASNVYFADQSIVEASFTRWHATGRGRIGLVSTRPVIPDAEPLNDRPWVTAHGDGAVLYLANEGDNSSYELGQGTNQGANGPGRYTVFRSTDHGASFDPFGYTLANSGSCKPVADHRPGSQTFYVLCTNDDHTLLAFVTPDNGQSFDVHPVTGYNPHDPWSTWPSAAVARDGSVYALYVDDDTRQDCTLNFCGPVPSRSHLLLLRSRDRGVHWQRREIPTPAHSGLVHYSALDVAPDGTVGLAFYYQPTPTAPWTLWAATGSWDHGFAESQATAAPVAPAECSPALLNLVFDCGAQGDFFEVAYGPDGRLNVAWTVDSDGSGLQPDVWFARQR